MKPTLRAGLATVVVVSLLAGCATVPTGPRVGALPGSRTTPEQFSADDAACRNYAQAALGPNAAQPSNDAAAANAVGATLFGAAIGALFGAAVGDPGAGAAIGAGTGLLGGSINAANASGYSTYALQRGYDQAYLQCMYARGHQVPGRVAYRAAPGRFAPPAGAAYPPPNTPPPGTGYPPPPSAGYPPPNTPPPGYRPPPSAVPAPGYPPPSAVPPPSGFPAPGTPPPG